ncbi:MAG: sigma-70 family RNA polymerase sigma factor [Hydrogenoanaerobacterium sp.]
MEQLTAEEQTKWGDILNEMEREEINNNRRHEGWRDDLDITVLDSKPDPKQKSLGKKIKRMVKNPHFENIIYSKRPEDLAQLMSSGTLSRAIEALTEKQREVLFLRYVQQYTNTEIAEISGTTARNIRKHEEKALDMLRMAVGIIKDKKGEGNVDTLAKILAVLIFPTFAFGWRRQTRYTKRRWHNKKSVYNISIA